MPIQVNLLEPNIFLMRYVDAVGLQDYITAYANMRTQMTAANLSGTIAHIVDMTDCTLIFDDLLGSVNTLREYHEVKVYALIAPPRNVRLMSDVLVRVLPELQIAILPDMASSLAYCRDHLTALRKIETTRS